MRLRFSPPLLHALDTVDAEALACVVWEDRRPLDGLAALCDWRLGGTLSRLLVSRFATGAEGESLLVPGRPALGFDKLLFLGGGPLEAFDEARFDRIVAHAFRVLDGLGCASAVLQLPGRQAERIAPERAADRLLAALGTTRSRLTSITLVEDHDARRKIEQHMVEERRRLRPSP